MKEEEEVEMDEEVQEDGEDEVDRKEETKANNEEETNKLYVIVYKLSTRVQSETNLP